MINPSNIVSLYGRVLGCPVVLKDTQGTEFALRFELSVKRGYRNRDGMYPEDAIPVKYVYDSTRANFAHSVEPGDLLQVSGMIQTEMYKGKKLIYIISDAMSYDEETRRRKYSPSSANETADSAEYHVDLPLPY